MKLIVTECKYQIASESFKCEAFNIFKSIHINDTELSAKDAILLFKSRFGMVNSGERYLQFLFVDDFGELLDFRCSLPMNKLMVRTKLYPELILTAIEEFKNTHNERKHIASNT